MRPETRSREGEWPYLRFSESICHVVFVPLVILRPCITPATPLQHPASPSKTFSLPPLNLLTGRSGSEVVALSSALNLPGLLLSLSRDGGLSLWDVRAGACIGASDSDACTAVRDRDEKT